MHTKLKYGYKLGSIFPGYNYLHFFASPQKSSVQQSTTIFFCLALIAIYSIASYTWPKHLVGPLNQTGLVTYNQNMVVYKEACKSTLYQWFLSLVAICQVFLVSASVICFHFTCPNTYTKYLKPSYYVNNRLYYCMLLYLVPQFNRVVQCSYGNWLNYFMNGVDWPWNEIKIFCKLLYLVHSQSSYIVSMILVPSRAHWFEQVHKS